MPHPANDLGERLRHWRGQRGKSQLDLSLDVGISQRHISFIESGRSQPSRQALLDIAEGLDIPLRDRNTLLLAAGYAPLYSEAAWNAPELQRITGALQRMLRQQEPYPALVLDRYWNVLFTNEAAPRFFTHFTDLSRRPTPRNLLDLLFDPAGLRPCIANWPELARAMLARIRREATGRVLDAQLHALIARLQAYPEIPQAEPAENPDLPMVPITLLHQGRALSYFSIISTIGTPQSVAAQELRLECMFPADAATEAAHLALMASRL